MFGKAEGTLCVPGRPGRRACRSSLQIHGGAPVGCPSRFPDDGARGRVEISPGLVLLVLEGP